MHRAAAYCSAGGDGADRRHLPRSRRSPTARLVARARRAVGVARRLQRAIARQAARRAAAARTRSPSSPNRAFALSYASANGGRAIEWTIANGAIDARSARQPRPRGQCRARSRSGRRTHEYGRRDRARLLDRRTSADDRRTTSNGSAEWTVAAGVARSVNLFQSTAGRAYAVQTIGWSRELTRELTLGSAFAGGSRGASRRRRSSRSSIRRRFTASASRRWCGDGTSRRSRRGRRSRSCRWAGCGRRDPIPENTSRGNFTAHWGGGVRLRPRGGHALLLAYRFQHFSNGNQLGLQSRRQQPCVPGRLVSPLVALSSSHDADSLIR